MPKRIISALAVAGAALALVGCGYQGAEDGGDMPVVEANEVVSQGVPDGWPEDMDGGPIAGWITEGETFAVVTWGSSGCPPLSETMQVLNDGHLKLTFVPPEAEVCTADFAPTTHEFELPDGLTERPITLTVEFTEIDDSVSAEEFELP